jgi:hypothetical protein
MAGAWKKCQEGKKAPPRARPVVLMDRFLDPTEVLASKSVRAAVTASSSSSSL